MEETFNALTGSLHAVYSTDLDRNIDYVDALEWTSEDFSETFYIVGSNIIDGETEDYIDSEIYPIPVEFREEIIHLMMDYEGNRQDNFYESLRMSDILSIIGR